VRLELPPEANVSAWITTPLSSNGGIITDTQSKEAGGHKPCEPRSEQPATTHSKPLRVQT